MDKTVKIEFSGSQGSGKTTLSAHIRAHLKPIGLSANGSSCGNEDDIYVSVDPKVLVGLRQTKPAAWLHKIQEPEGQNLYMFSKSKKNPWSHWVAARLEECTYMATPLFAGHDPLPQDVINLVITAREAFDRGELSVELDKALEAFSERVPYADEPAAKPEIPPFEWTIQGPPLAGYVSHGLAGLVEEHILPILPVRPSYDGSSFRAIVEIQGRLGEVSEDEEYEGVSEETLIDGVIISSFNTEQVTPKLVTGTMSPEVTPALAEYMGLNVDRTGKVAAATELRQRPEALDPFRYPGLEAEVHSFLSGEVPALAAGSVLTWSNVTPADLGLDSLDMLEITLAAEEQWPGVDFPEKSGFDIADNFDHIATAMVRHIAQSKDRD